MKIKCIDNVGQVSLTLDKEYTVIESTDKMYGVVDDDKYLLFVNKDRFEVKED